MILIRDMVWIGGCQILFLPLYLIGLQMITELSGREVKLVSGAGGEGALIGGAAGWIAGRVAGAEAGGIAGAAIGSVAPGVGTVGGAIIGAAAGGMYGPAVGAEIGGYLGDKMQEAGFKSWDDLYEAMNRQSWSLKEMMEFYDD